MRSVRHIQKVILACLEAGKVSYELLQFCESLTFVGLDQRSNGDGASDHARIVIAHVGNRAMNVA